MKLARLLVAFRFLAPGPAAKPQAASVRSRRQARAAVWSGVVVFAALTAALSGAVETLKPEWRDPEFGRRLVQLRKWQADAPGRPLVLAVGSSRTQMSLSPADMGLPGGPTDPLVYNLGYRGTPPLGWWLNLERAWDAGVRPKFVLVQLAPWEAAIGGPAEEQFAHWSSQTAVSDLLRLAPHTQDPRPLRNRWLQNAATPWSVHREAILSDLLPDWQPPRRRAHFAWERMDEYGFSPHPLENPTEDFRRRQLNQAKTKQMAALNGVGVSPESDRAFREIVAKCRAEGVRVAFFRAPESAAYRALYTPAGRAAIDHYTRTLTDELGVPVFPMPEHLTEADFADGFHLIRSGAAKYSRWLAETHLKPWLAAHP